jgi:hypothetical protein
MVVVQVDLAPWQFCEATTAHTALTALVVPNGPARIDIYSVVIVIPLDAIR